MTRGAGGGSATGGVTWQALNISATKRAAPRNRTVDGRTMEWIYLEAAIALALLIAIVWWTMAARHKPGRGKPPEQERE